MKFNFYNYKFSFFFLLVLIGSKNSTSASAISAVATGNWSATSTWSGGQVPGPADDVTIGAFTVTVTAPAACNNLSLSTATSNLRVQVLQTLTVSGNYSSGATTSDGVNGPGALIFIGNTTINSIFTEIGTFPDVVIGNTITSNTVVIDKSVAISRLAVMTNATLNININDSLIVWGDVAINGTGSGSGAIIGQGNLNLALVNHLVTGNATIAVATFSTTTGGSNVITFAGTADAGGPAKFTFTGDSVVNMQSGGSTAPLINVNAGAELTLSAATRFSHRTYAYLMNYGLITINNQTAGALSVATSSRFDNEGTLILNQGATGSVIVSGSGTFKNNGIINFNGSSPSPFVLPTSISFTNGVNGVMTFASTTGNNMSFPSSNHFTNDGIINASSNINFGSTVWFTNNGTINSSASSTIFTISTNSSSYAINNGTITSTGTGNISLSNNTTFTNNGTVTLPGSVVGANATKSVWMQGGNDALLDIKGVLLANGALNAGNYHNTVKYSGTGQTVKTPVGRYDKLEIATSTTATMTATDTVSTELILTSGKLVTGANTLILDSTATITGGSSTAYVHGNLQKKFLKNTVSVSTFKFEIGDANTYAPASVDFASIATGGSLKANTTGSEHPNIASSLLEPTLSVNRYWTFTNSGLVFTTATATFNWAVSDQDAGVNTSKFIVGKYDSPTWTYPIVANPLSASIQATAITTFSDFVVAEIKNIGIESIGVSDLLNVYPNPSSGSFAIDMKNVSEGLVQILNCAGQEVYNESISNLPAGKKVIDLNVDAGIYFVKVIDGEKQYFQKLAIQ